MRVTAVPDRFPWTRNLDLVYSDLDTVGHVNNVAIARYFQEGRVDLYRLVRADLPSGQELDLRLAHVEIDYLAEINYPGRVLLGIGVLALGTTSCRTESAIFHDGRCAARSQSVDVCVDPNTARATRLNLAHREAFGRWLIQA